MQFLLFLYIFISIFSLYGRVLISSKTHVLLLSSSHHFSNSFQVLNLVSLCVWHWFKCVLTVTHSFKLQATLGGWKEGCEATLHSVRGKIKGVDSGFKLGWFGYSPVLKQHPASDICGMVAFPLLQMVPSLH